MGNVISRSTVTAAERDELLKKSRAAVQDKAAKAAKATVPSPPVERKQETSPRAKRGLRLSLSTEDDRRKKKGSQTDTASSSKGKRVA